MKVKAYLSHPIMGIKGKESTEEDIDKNNNKAVFFGKTLRFAFPELDLHVPADMEAFVHRAYKLKHLSINQILDVDCHIIYDCDFVIYYDHQRGFSDGMKTEEKFAKTVNIPGITVTSLSDETLFRIESVIKEILEEKLKENNND